MMILPLSNGINCGSDQTNTESERNLCFAEYAEMNCGRASSSARNAVQRLEVPLTDAWKAPPATVLQIAGI